MSFQAYIDNIRAKTGLGPEDFKALAPEKGLVDAKAGVVIAWLKADYGLGQGHGMAIWSTFKPERGVDVPAETRLDKLLSGGRAAWRPAWEGYLAAAQAFGADVGVSPADKYASLTRGGRKFAIFQPGASFLDLGFKRPGVAADGRFASAAGWNDMLTHRTRIAAGESVDPEILTWLRAAYDAAG